MKETIFTFEGNKGKNPFYTFKWGIIAVIPANKSRIYHFCGYEEKPEDIKEAIEHVWQHMVANDELEPMLLYQMELREAPQHVLDHFNKILVEEVHPQMRKMEEENGV